MSNDNDPPKWEAKSTAKLCKSSVEEVWPLVEDFCSFDKWLPTIDTCHKIEGSNGEPGLVRYCAATDGGGGVLRWCHEKLVTIDPSARCLSYQVLENNMGIKGYMSTIKVIPMDGGDGLHGCLIEWSFLADPVEGMSFGDMANYLDLGLRAIAENIEKALEKSELQNID
ncbi:lachrymatory-factor synthase-like [Dorcoceras hygrometricum]|uniref:Lachrymatory-factor synthase-like n=1 Tax=Dorcoceras hygrometricum TaxID=472368 RepID=A0A2Z7CBV7_9LAMI|nr:lachrymatory-factor synthase-like [Dorcoceras hygrometricum]